MLLVEDHSKLETCPLGERASPHGLACLCSGSACGIATSFCMAIFTRLTLHVIEVLFKSVDRIRKTGRGG